METSSESDPRKGGSFVYRFDMTDEAKAGGKPDHAETGTYTEFQRATALAFPWDSTAPTNVRFTFEKTSTGCALHLVHSDVPEPMMEPIAGGWQFFLGNLKSVLEGGPDSRASFGLAVPAPA